jgi:peroxidase
VALCPVQMNQVTGYLDGSNIYGSSLTAQRELREGRGGRLAVQRVGGRQLLPANRGECTDDTERLACFRAGECARPCCPFHGHGRE